MIQRIQSVYLLVVTCLLGIVLCMPIGRFVAGDGVRTAMLEPLGITLFNGDYLYTWGMFVILLLSAIISFCSIFLFRNRPMQMRMVVFNILLLIGFYIVYTLFVIVLKGHLGAQSFQIEWALCLPVIAIILDYLAFRAIRRDELLVKAADRIR